MIEFLRSYEDCFAAIESFFALQPSSGVKVGVTKSFNQYINTNVGAAVEKPNFQIAYNKFGQMQPVLLPSLAYHGGISGSAFERVSYYAELSNGTLQTQISSLLSPFLINDTKIATDFRHLLASSSMSMRQPYSNISFRFQSANFEKPQLSDGSFTLGRNDFLIGARIVPTEAKKFSSEFLIRLALDDVTTQISLAKSDVISAIAAFHSKLNDNASVGLRVQTSSVPGNTMIQLGWNNKIGESMVRSMITSTGVIVSNYNRKITDDIRLSITGSLDHLQKDYKFGFEFNIDA